MERKILLTQSVEDASEGARIGGKALLPATHEWPVNADGEPLVLIISLPASFLNEIRDFSIPSHLYVSVFSTYSKDGYFLDSITSSGQEDSISDISDEYTKVLFHGKGIPRNESPYLVPAKGVEVEKEEAFDNYTGSKIGNEPGWLQNENIDFGKFRFVLQLYSSDFPEDYEDIFYLTDAVGYLFVSDNDKEGRFFVQST